MIWKITPAHAAAALVFVAAAGISSMHTTKVDPETTATPASSKAHIREESRAKRYGAPEVVRQRMEKIRQTKDPGERMRETVELVNSLPIAELRRWLERGWFSAGDGYEKKVFTLLAKERWKKDDPEGFAAWGLKTEKDGRDVLVEWARTDPDRMLMFFQKHPNPMLELQLWATASNLDPGFAMRRLLELTRMGAADPNFNYWPVDKLAAVIAKGNLALLEAHLNDLPVEWRGKVEGAIVAAKLQADFPTEVARLAEMPDGWSLLTRARQGMEGFSLKVLDSVESFPESWKASLANDPGGLVNDPRWLDVDLKALGFTPDQARKILTEAMRMAVFSSAERVLGGLHEADLTDEQRKTVLASLFHPGNDPKNLAGALASLKSPELRQLAESMMTPPSAPQEKVANVTEETLAPAQGNRMEQLAEKGSSGNFDSSQEATGWGNPLSIQFMQESAGWNEETAAAMLRDFKSLPEEKKRAAAAVIAGQPGGGPDMEMSRVLGGEAIRFLIEDLPKVDESGRAKSEERQSNQAALHAAAWVQDDPSAASQWVLTLPAGKPRDQAIQLLTTTWRRYDPDAAERWVGGLPAADKKSAEIQK